MNISTPQAKSFARLGLQHVCRLDRVSEAEVSRLVQSTDLSLPALIDAIVQHAAALRVVDIACATWRQRLEHLAAEALALQYQLSVRQAMVNVL